MSELDRMVAAAEIDLELISEKKGIVYKCQDCVYGSSSVCSNPEYDSPDKDTANPYNLCCGWNSIVGHQNILSSKMKRDFLIVVVQGQILGAVISPFFYGLGTWLWFEFFTIGFGFLIWYFLFTDWIGEHYE